jgi:acetylornithine deacetylase
VRAGDSGGKSLLYNAHTDVVKVSEEQERSWTELGPFDGGVKNGKVWGRGATDMKSGATAMLYAAAALKELGIKLKGDFLLTFVDGEESGRADIGIWSLIDKGYTADFGIMTEPSNLHIFNKSKGEIYYDIKITGESTHICNRYKTIWPQKSRSQQLGVNAIDKMVRLINAFTELERSWGLDYYDPDLDPGTTTLAISRIDGGESFSAQAGACTMTVASMFDPQLSVEDISRQIIATIDYVADHDYWLKDHRPEYSLPFPPKVPLNVSADDEVVRAAVLAFEQIMNGAPKLGPSPFVGDMNYLFEKGVKCIVWGPGDIALAHGTNEYVEVEQLISAAKLYAATAVNCCGVA